MPLQAFAEPGRGEGLTVGSGVSLASGEADPSGPTLGVGAPPPPLALAVGACAEGADNAADGEGDPVVTGDGVMTGDGVGVPPHAATSAATPIRARSRGAGAARQKRWVMVTSRA